MSYFILEDFRLGQDTRKSPLTAAPGTLTALTNGHITRGGEVEKRKAFVSTYTLPSGTFGLAALGTALYVFGSAADPGMPAGITYQRLQHPTAQAMVEVETYDIFDGKLYVSARFADGATYQFYDGTRVTDFVDGQARGSFDITGGTASAGVNKVTSIKVNGIEVLSTAVDWTTSHSATATAVAAQVNSYNSTPEYTAVADGPKVIIIAATGSGTTPNGYSITVTKAGDVTVSTPTTMDGGDAAGSLTAGAAVKTFGTKMHTISGSKLVVSAVNAPTDYNDTTSVGSDLINMSNHASGSATLTALEAFYNYLAIFAEQAIQVWQMDADPDASAKVQVIQKTGTRAMRSVKPFGDGDLFYLADPGVRALKAREATNVGTVSEVGTAIDKTVTAQVAAVGTTVAADAVAEIEPIDKRYMLAIGDQVYVYSYFPGSKIAAWSTYTPGFTITAFAVVGQRLYARSGNAIYLYGGSANDTYDTSVLTVDVPYIDAKSPGHRKKLTGVDIVAEGEWFVQVASNPEEPDALDDIGTFTDTTLHQESMPAQGESTYFMFRFTHSAAEYARLSRFLMHFEKGDAKSTDGS